jgi:hypothetical protein
MAQEAVELSKAVIKKYQTPMQKIVKSFMHQ